MTHIEGTIEQRGISVTLVDDNQTYRSVLKTMISDYPQVGSVQEAGDADEFFANLSEPPPDLIIMDVSMPGMDGFEATERLLAQHPSAKVIILTIHNTDEHRSKARQAGAVAFMPKQAVADRLEAVLNGLFNEVRAI